MKTLLISSRRGFRKPSVPTFYLVLTILCPAVGRAESFTNSPRTDFWVPDGVVNALALQGNTLYLGGQFQSLRRNPQTTGVALDFGTLTPDPVFPAVKGVVQAVAGDGVGGFFLGGTFTSVGGVARTNLAYVDRDGIVTGWNPGANGAVLGLALADGVLYVGGEFSVIGSQSRSFLAAVDGVTGLATTWNPNPDKRVKTLILSGNILYAAGDFLGINNVSRHFLAAWDNTSGTLLPWNPNPQGGGVAALAVLGDAVFAGGDFTSIGGATRSGLAALHGWSGLAFPWNPSGTNSGISITALAIKGTTLYTGGSFSSLGGQVRRGLCALDVDTALAGSWNPSVSNVPSAAITAIAAFGDTVFVTGTFTNINGVAHNGFAALDSIMATVRPLSFGLVFPGTVIGISHRTVYLGGAALNASVARRNLAAVDVRTGEPTAWNPGCDGPVSALLAASNRIYVGGAFTNLGGTLRANLASVDPVSGAPHIWIPNPNAEVLTLAPSPTGGSNIFVGGRFTFIGGQSRNRIAALDAFGSATAWNPGADAPVYALAAATDGSSVIFAGGSFTNIAGLSRSRLAALNEFSGAALSGNRDANGLVRALAASGGDAYVGGDFFTVGGQPRAFLALVDQAGTATNWNPGAAGSVSSLAVAADFVVAGGSFTNAGGFVRKGLAALDKTNGAPTAWNPDAAISVNSVLATSNAIFAGGRFVSLNNSFAPGLAAFAPVSAPVITVQPVSQRVLPGSLVILTVGAMGAAPLTYQWRWGGFLLPGATNQSLTLPNLQTNTGDYTVEVANNFGAMESEIASVTLLLPPVILAQTTNQTVAAGGTISLSVPTSGNPPPQIFWRRNETLLGAHSGSSLVFSNAQPGDGGHYDALIINAAGSVVSTSIVFKVIPPSAIGLTDNLTNAFLSAAANGVAVGNNSNATSELNEPLHVGAPGGKSVWMSWFAASNGLARFDTLGSDFDTLLAIYTTTNNGSLVSVAGDDDSAGYQNSTGAFNAVAGQTYRIAVDGLSGRYGNIILTWRLDPSVHIPTITQSPTNTVVPVGTTAVFSVSATELQGYLPLTYQWFHGQRALVNATNATLTIPNAGSNDLGEYTVFVKNNDCQTAQSDWAFLELSSAPSVRREIKYTVLTSNIVSGLAGTSLIRTRKLTTEPELGAPGFCGSLPAGFRASASFGSALPVYNASLTNGPPRIETVPRSTSAQELSDCGTTVWMEYAFKVYADIPGVLFVRTTGASVILSALQLNGDGQPPSVLTDPSIGCGIGNTPMIRIGLKKGTNYLYSIVTRRTSPTPQSDITEERILCPHPGVAGYVITQPTATFQPFAYTNNGVVLSAQVTNLNSLCEQSFRWLKDGVPISGEFTPSLLVTNPTGFAQYSLVVSNCAGAVTNVVGTLVQLEIYKNLASGPLKLRSVPIITNIFRIEAATNLAGATSAWYPFFTNQPGPGHQLPIDLPSGTISNMFFRARPSP